MENKLIKILTTMDCWDLFQDSEIKIKSIDTKFTNGILLNFGRVDDEKMKKLFDFCANRIENKFHFIKTASQIKRLTFLTIQILK